MWGPWGMLLLCPGRCPWKGAGHSSSSGTPGSTVSPGPPPKSPVQASSRPTFSSSAFCQRRKRSRKQRSRAPKEVKKCCRREMGFERDTKGWRGSSIPIQLCPNLHPDVYPFTYPFIHSVECLSCAQPGTGRWSHCNGEMVPSSVPRARRLRQAHLQMGSVQRDWAGRRDAQSNFPISFAHWVVN